ncbi:hypothetical protein FNI11_17855 [Salmonella enterica subsp. salamae]|nr:hypothetical protein [Salmonella enterica subsp. salamae]ECJ2282499.1 hypothetical protein [Salmonella enterica subsp. salamae]HCC0887076.1 hypothetical protein [Salmonella enterica]
MPEPVPSLSVDERMIAVMMAGKVSSGHAPTKKMRKGKAIFNSPINEGALPGWRRYQALSW